MSAVKHDIFQAIADPTRREVLRILARKELPISKITEHFSISRTAIVKHLNILSKANLVQGRKEGERKTLSIAARTFARGKRMAVILRTVLE